MGKNKKNKKNKKTKELKQSKIQLVVKETKATEELQRTEKWREERRGRWTGSGFLKLMSCSPGKGGLAWDNLDKILSIGKTALKEIYGNMMERKTGMYIDEGEGTYQMKYGTIVEPFIFKEAERILKKKKIKGKLEECGFKTFEKVKSCGVSSDGLLMHKEKKVGTVEMKACTNWGTHYDRTFELTSEKSKDFWQNQGQLMVHGVKKSYYFTASPPHDIMKYVFYNGDIWDLYDDWIKECNVTMEIIKPSTLHQEALLKRIKIAEDVISDYLSDPSISLKDTLEQTVLFYQNKPEKFDEFVNIIRFQSKKEKKRKKREK